VINDDSPCVTRKDSQNLTSHADLPELDTTCDHDIVSRWTIDAPIAGGPYDTLRREGQDDDGLRRIIKGTVVSLKDCGGVTHHTDR
jgi:hypothetical protein